MHVTLISNQNFFLFPPMLAEAATGAVETRHILYPIRPLCGAWGVEFGEMHVEAIDLEDRTVDLKPREGFVVPRGVLHRTRAPERVVILMAETSTIVPTGDA